MGVNVKGGNNSAGIANVSSTYDLNVVTPMVEIDGGFVQVSAEVDAGNVLGTRTVRAMEISDDYRVRVGMDQTLLNIGFEGTIISQAVFQQGSATMTTVQASGFLGLNAGNATATGNQAHVRSYRHFPTFGTYPTFLTIWMREANHTATNAISEWGLFHLATIASVAAPTDGIFWRRLAGGGLKAVANYNGTEVETAVDVTNVPGRNGEGAYAATDANHYLISYHSDYARFWINDIAVAEIPCPSNQPAFTSSSNTPVAFRVYNSGTASAGRRIEIGYINIGGGDQNTNKPWPHVMSGSGSGAYQIQPGTASGSTVSRGAGALGYPTSGTARAAGTWTATTAPALNSLGGLWTSPALSTLTTDTDYPVFSYLNPIGTATLPGKTLFITGVRAGECYVSTVAGVTAANLTLSVGVGSTAVATTATEGVAIVAARVLPIGSYGFIAAGATGTNVPGFAVSFNSPLIVPAGTYFHVIVRPFVGIGCTLVVTSSFFVNGYFE